MQFFNDSNVLFKFKNDYCMVLSDRNHDIPNEEGIQSYFRNWLRINSIVMLFRSLVTVEP